MIGREISPWQPLRKSMSPEAKVCFLEASFVLSLKDSSGHRYSVDNLVNNNQVFIFFPPSESASSMKKMYTNMRMCQSQGFMQGLP